jgi:hypothetical protein
MNEGDRHVEMQPLLVRWVLCDTSLQGGGWAKSSRGFEVGVFCGAYGTTVIIATRMMVVVYVYTTLQSFLPYLCLYSSLVTMATLPE